MTTIGQDQGHGRHFVTSGQGQGQGLTSLVQGVVLRSIGGHGHFRSHDKNGGYNI